MFGCLGIGCFKEAKRSVSRFCKAHAGWDERRPAHDVAAAQTERHYPYMPPLGDLTDLLLAGEASDPTFREDIATESNMREQARWAWGNANELPFPRPEKAASTKLLPPPPATPDSDWTCPVCLEQKKPDDTPEQFCQISACKHCFHKACVSRWLSTTVPRSCPLCRTQDGQLEPFCQTHWLQQASTSSLVARPALSWGIAYIQSLPPPLQEFYGRSGTWITPINSIREALYLRSQGPLLLPSLPPEFPAAARTRKPRGLYKSVTAAIENVEWQRILAVKTLERQRWGCFDAMPFPSPRLWQLDCGIQLPLCPLEGLRVLHYVEPISCMLTSATLAWEMFPRRVLEFGSQDQWDACCQGGFCRRDTSEPFTTSLSEDSAWVVFPSEVILNNQLLPRQEVLEHVRALRGPLRLKQMISRRACMAARFKCDLPSDSFFGDVLPRWNDPLGPGAVMSRSQSYKATHAAAITVLEQQGGRLTVFPRAGLWPGPRLADLWAKRAICMRWTVLTSRMVADFWSSRRSCSRCALLTPRMSVDHCTDRCSSGSCRQRLCFDAQTCQTTPTDGSVATSITSPDSSGASAMVWSPPAMAGHDVDYQCEQGLVARMVSRFGG